MRDLSVIIPARNEMFLKNTIEDVLANIEADTEVIAICDGNWPDPPVLDHPRVIVVHHTESIGQRAATNEGARISQAKFVMKLDAHCSVDKGFDVKLMQDCYYKRTLIPMMYNLHAFDWVCKSCGTRTYQGVKPEKCASCVGTEHDMGIVWKPRENRLTVSWRFDNNMQFQYWKAHSKRPEAQGDLIETMSFIGACWITSRDNYWEMDGLDEGHGSWGQMGTEIACKTWLSGGQLLTSKKTWFAHMFRTGNFGGRGWPYPISQSDIDKARQYSRDLWLNDAWPKAVRPLSWLVSKFSPVPTFNPPSAAMNQGE